MRALNEENLYRPFIAEDGLEYDDFAAFLCGQPQDTWRNSRIQEHRKAGRSEAALRQWIKGYDGDDPRTTAELTGGQRGEVVVNRQKRGWWAVDDDLKDKNFRLAPDAGLC